MTDRSLREGIGALGRDGFIAQLHAEAPLYRDAMGFWVVSRFEDVRAILTDPARFSSAVLPPTLEVAFPLLTDDPPRHGMLRAMLAKAFTPAAIEAVRPYVEGLARDLVAALPAQEEIDIVERFTSPLPIAVIATMMGVPQTCAADFRTWSNTLIGIQQNPFDPVRLGALAELRGYFTGVAAERRGSSGPDLISALIRVRETSEVLSDDQVVGFCVLLLVAGNETTTNLLGNLLNRLTRRPEDWAALRADPSLIESAIEESLRVDSPLQMAARRAVADVEIGGQRIAAGDMVMTYLGSANQDPAKWNAPANFEINRVRERHIAFGHGIHACIGAPLARMQAKAAMTALTARFARIGPGAEKGRRVPPGPLYGFRNLPVVLG